MPDATIIDLEEWRYQVDRPRWNMEPSHASRGPRGQLEMMRYRRSHQLSRVLPRKQKSQSNQSGVLYP